MKTIPKISAAALAAALLLAGCAAQTPAPAAENLPAAPVVQARTLSALQEAKPDPMLEKYVDVLEGIYYDNVLPDGQRLDPFEEAAEDYPNEFAVYDVDADGEDELIIRYINTYSAGMFGVVYGFDRTENRLTTQLFEFPALSFYPNGIVEASWSHNQGLAGRFWPCTLYRYDAVSDSYLPAACVDAWDREFFETDYDGNPFPADADPNGNNIVYYIYKYGEQGMPAPVSQEEFDLWYHDLIGFDPAVDSHPEFTLDLPFQPLTEENILAIT